MIDFWLISDWFHRAVRLFVWELPGAVLGTAASVLAKTMSDPWLCFAPRIHFLPFLKSQTVRPKTNYTNQTNHYDHIVCLSGANCSAEALVSLFLGNLPANLHYWTLCWLALMLKMSNKNSHENQRAWEEGSPHHSAWDWWGHDATTFLRNNVVLFVKKGSRWPNVDWFAVCPQLVS